MPQDHQGRQTQEKSGKVYNQEDPRETQQLNVVLDSIMGNKKVMK